MWPDSQHTHYTNDRADFPQWKLVSICVNSKITKTIKCHSIKLIKSNSFLVQLKHIQNRSSVFTCTLNNITLHYKYNYTLRCGIQDQRKKPSLHLKPDMGSSDSCWRVMQTVFHKLSLFIIVATVNKASKQVFSSGDALSTTRLWNSAMWLVNGEG